MECSQTNATTARIFPEVLDVENPEFFQRLDKLVETNTALLALGKSDSVRKIKLKCSRIEATYPKHKSAVEMPG